ncbi:MAG TPA: right-handed parallel beta-helix repeat-containing protein [Phycisphaerales bacterium]|nr:right-handed parallel beta-helix repeat-containing protein [Phycisphaerales bacterium]
MNPLLPLTAALPTFLLPCVAAGQLTIYASADLATGADNGTSWANAFRGPDALARAIASLPPGQREIWVARGTYVASLTPTRNSSFVLPAARTVIGGFAGTETSPFQRNIAANPTILTGDFAGDDAPWPSTAGRAENAFHVVRTAGTGGGGIIRLDGFIIRGGAADTQQPVLPSSLAGAGLYVDANNAIEVRNCVFEGNTGNASAAVFAGGSSISMHDCTVRRNTATFGTAGLGVDQVSSAGVNRCRFEDNTCITPSGGAAIASAGNSVSLINSLFARNNAAAAGPGTALAGAVVMGRTSTSGPGTLFVRNCTFVSNSCNAQTGGILVQGAGSQAFVYNTLLFGNAGPGGDPQVVALPGAASSVTYSLVQGGIAGTGNIAAEPLFVDPLGGDFRLRAGSPGIDAGNNSRLDAQYSTDLAGGNRRFDDPATPNTGSGTPPIDIGCYERQRCTPDMGATGGVAGGDGTLDNNDFIVFIDLFFARSNQADIGRTGGIPGIDEQFDNNDFVVFIDLFFAGCP